MPSGKLCQAYGCNNRSGNKKGVRFHYFPENEDICKQWVVNIRNKNLDKLKHSDLRKRHRVVCSEHFNDDQYVYPELRHDPACRLLKSAVPNVVNASIKPKRKSPKKRVNLSPVSTIQPIDSIKTNVDQLTTYNNDVIIKIKQKYKNSISNLSKKKCAIKRLRAKLQAQSKLVKSCKSCDSFNQLPKTVYRFIESQLQHTSRKKWKPHDIQLALGIKFRSTSAYKYLQAQGFSLPSIRTLQRNVQSVMVNCGPCVNLLSSVAEKINSMEPCDRIATLSFDAMSISPAIRYESHKDEVCGYEDVGLNKKSLQIADQGMIAMLRGVRSKWKQVIGYYLIKHSVKQDRFLAIVNDCLTKCHKHGIEIIALVCDQETTQFAALRSQGVSPDHPYLVHPCSGQKVFVVIDIPHCLKNTRNSLHRGYVIHFDGNKKASWKYLVQLFDLENKSTLKLAPKLKPVHFNLPPGKNMRVNLAAQVLSRSVGKAIRTYVHFNLMPSEALETAEFVEQINDLFDILNSNSSLSKGLKCAIKATFGNKRKEYLERCKIWISKWSFLNTSMKNTHLSFPIAWQISISSICFIADYLINIRKFRFVTTRRYTQDHVENLFSLVRSHNGPNENPEYHQFRSAIKSCSVSHLLQPTNKNTNCEADNDHNLISFSSELQNETMTSVSNDQDRPIQSNSVDVTIEEILNDDSHVFNFIEEECLSYIGGYLISKITIDCDHCKSLLTDSILSSEFLKHKQYRFAISGLIQPSKRFLNVLKECEMDFRSNIFSAIMYGSVLRYLSEKCRFAFKDCTNHEHDWQIKLKSLFLRTRIHHFCKQQVRKLKEKQTEIRSTKRKLKKFSCA